MTPDEAKTKAWELVNQFVAMDEIRETECERAAQLVDWFAAALLEVAGYWNADMDAAPKHEPILAHALDHDGPLILRWFKYNGAEAWRDWDNDAQRPTHWWRLPAPLESAL